MKTPNHYNRQIIGALAIAIALFTPALSHAQSAPGPSLKPKIYLGGGVAPIASPDSLKDDYKSKFTLFGAVGLELTPGLEARFVVHYNDYDWSNKLQALQGQDPNQKYTMIGADLKWALLPKPSPVRPYFLAGAGSMTSSNDLVPDESNFYVNGGGGVDVKLGPSFAAFAEMKYVILNTSGEATALLPLIFGIRIL